MPAFSIYTCTENRVDENQQFETVRFLIVYLTFDDFGCQHPFMIPAKHPLYFSDNDTEFKVLRTEYAGAPNAS